MKTTLRKYLKGKNFRVKTVCGLNIDEYLESGEGESLYLFFESEKPALPQRLFDTVIENLDRNFKFSHFPLVGKVTYGIMCEEDRIFKDKIL